MNADSVKRMRVYNRLVAGGIIINTPVNWSNFKRAWSSQDRPMNDWEIQRYEERTAIESGQHNFHKVIEQ